MIKERKRLVLVEYTTEYKDKAEQTAREIEQRTGEVAIALPAGGINVRLGWFQ